MADTQNNHPVPEIGLGTPKKIILKNSKAEREGKPLTTGLPTTGAPTTTPPTTTPPSPG